MTRDNSKQSRFREGSLEVQAELEGQRTEDGKIICLGKEFDTIGERRAHFSNILQNSLDELESKLSGEPFVGCDDAKSKLQSLNNWNFGGSEGLSSVAEGISDLAKNTDNADLLSLIQSELGFPDADIDKIMELSDPPYYTACPNPFMKDFIYSSEIENEDGYSREPFATDVSEGKGDWLYQAHTYPTKVPHQAIVPAILHYTRPGDLILDGFSGTGMTGVASQFCSHPTDKIRAKVEKEFDQQDLSDPEWGPRRVLLNDLSPLATFIAANYNLPFDLEEFEEEAWNLLESVKEELGWMYKTTHPETGEVGLVNYTVWSEVFSCPDCAGEITYLNEALDMETGSIRETFPCPTCEAEVTKNRLDLLQETVFDEAIDETIERARREPVLINYEFDGESFSKVPDDADITLLDRIEDRPYPELPTTEIPYMHMTHERADMKKHGITHTHHFFLPRSAHSLSKLWAGAEQIDDHRIRDMLLFLIEHLIWTFSVMNRFRPNAYSQAGQFMTGVYYVPSQHAEVSPWFAMENKIGRLVSAFSKHPQLQGLTSINTGNCAHLSIPSASVDYIFTDPPFGENIYYADLNFLSEAFHSVWTRPDREAIVDKAKGKNLEEYQSLMTSCFKEYARVLKPNHWITVVFHNSSNRVWNAIQEAILSSGLVVADVRTLDKQQGSYRQVTSSAVKQDLVISAYKPGEQIETAFRAKAGTEEGVWDFIENHLRQLPVFVQSGEDEAEVVAEREDYLLFDRMVAVHLQRGLTVPMSASEFYSGLTERFEERDGMYFLRDQASEYDRKRAQVTKIEQSQLSITDESSAIKWLRGELKRKPQTFQELQPEFMQMVRGWEEYEEAIELKEILDQNFLKYEGESPIPDPLWSWMRQSETLRDEMEDRTPEDPGPTLKNRSENRWYVPDPRREADLEKLREEALMKEFESIASADGRVDNFRTEAVRVGFKRLWEQEEYQAILNVAKKIPTSAVEEDSGLLMYRDIARSRAATQTEISEDWSSEDVNSQ